MSKSSVKYATAWSWQSPKGKVWPEAFKAKSEAVSFYDGKDGSLVRVQLVPYKKK